MGDKADSRAVLKNWFLGQAPSSLPRILVLDGGVSTHLEHEILLKNNISRTTSSCSGSAGAFPYRELWSSGLLLLGEGRECIRQAHMDWLVAGASVISTVTYQCHYESQLWPQPQQQLQHPGDRMSDTTMDQMWRDGIDLARQAVAEYCLKQSSPDHQPDRHHFVLASSGCYGAALANGAEYTGDYGFINDSSTGDDTIDETYSALKVLKRFHSRKLHAAMAQGSPPDGVAIETVPSLVECRALCELLLDSEWDNIPGSTMPACYISLACRNGSQLNDGSPLPKALEILRAIPDCRLQAIGLNCCSVLHLPSLLDILVQELAQQRNEGTRRAIVIYPNSGEDWDAANEQWVAGTGVTKSHAMAQRLLELVQHIETKWRQCSDKSVPSILVGGCCRTVPATIAALSMLIGTHLAGE